MRSILAALALLLVAAPARAYLVALPRPLDDQANAADLVCKATVTADRAVTDPSFPDVPGYAAHETELRVVSVIKGTPGATFRFRHYAKAPSDVGMMYSPASIDLVAGKTYLVVAMRDGAGYRQTLMSGELDILTAADARPHHGKTLRAAAWAELTASLDGPDAAAAIGWIDQLSGGSDSQRTDFPRADAVDAVRAQVLAKDAAVATAAIEVVGQRSPYLHDERPFGALDLTTPRIAPDAKTVAVLLTAANAGPNRALAIRALGHAGAPAAALARWLADADPAVRASAVELSAETHDRSASACSGSRRASRATCTRCTSRAACAVAPRRSAPRCGPPPPA